MTTSVIELATATATPAVWAASVSPKWVLAPHLAVIDRALIEMFRGDDPRWLMVFMPVRHGKSELISAHLPAWYLGCHPDEEVILAGYGDQFAAQWGRRVRSLLEEHGERCFGIRIDPESRAKDDWGIAGHRGGMRSAGVGGGITGRGADLLVIDDPIKGAEQALSPTFRQKVWDWYESEAERRLSPTGKVVIVMTRWHADDVAGRLLERDAAQWRVIRLPCLAEEDDPLERKLGEPLWPDFWPAEKMAAIERHLTAYWWGALYQQRPGAYGETAWPDEYFENLWIAETQWPAKFDVSTIAIDPSKGKDSKKGDYTAMVFAGLKGRLVYVDARLRRIPPPQIVEDGLDWWADRRPDVFGVEGNQFQELLADEFMRRAAERGLLHFQVTPVENTLNKQIRIEKITPWLARHDLRFRPTAGCKELYRQLREFPNCDHDDGPDALEMALRLLDLAAEPFDDGLGDQLLPASIYG